MKRITMICAISLAVSLTGFAADTKKNDEKKGEAKTDFTNPPKLTAKAPDSYKARFDTSKGDRKSVV